MTFMITLLAVDGYQHYFYYYDHVHCADHPLDDDEPVPISPWPGARLVDFEKIKEAATRNRDWPSQHFLPKRNKADMTRLADFPAAADNGKICGCEL